VIARARRALVVVAVLAVAAACTRSSEPATSASGSEPAQPSSGQVASGAPTVAASRISLEPSEDGSSFLVRALYPKSQSECTHTHRGMFRARYPGAVSIKSKDGLLSMTVTLPFERYLEGLAEVPSSWPASALEAQAIAARTYALAHLGWSGVAGAEVPQPICGTTDCQVYGGTPVPPVRTRQRWNDAVQRTAGEVLLFDGRPADTVYYSTSNGHTYGNDQVFGSAPLPYLRPVVERDDTASPTSNWRVPFRFTDLATFLNAGGVWPEGAGISSVQRNGSNVAISGPSRSETLDAGTFRDTINAWASCLMPGRYPTDQLPTTIPSIWYDATSTHAGAVVTGRGWGHGVGMVQWGAHGKAKHGWSADRILAYYYGGLAPTSYPEPGLIHVTVASGLESLSIEAPSSGATINHQPVAGAATVDLVGDGETVTTGP